MDGLPPPAPPKQVAEYNLTTSKNGDPRAANAPKLEVMNAEDRSPASMMRAMGFMPDKKYMTPLQFLLAVVNDDLELIYKDPKKRKRTEDKGGIGLSYRVECAKTAARYMHMEMPKVSINEEGGNFGESLAKAAIAGNERLRTRTLILETVERISPDMPLSEASYPAIYQRDNTVAMNEDGVIEGEVLNPEGDKGYNPDED